METKKFYNFKVISYVKHIIHNEIIETKCKFV